MLTHACVHGIHILIASSMQLVTAKASEVNVTVVPKNDVEDPVEHAVAEQFISTFKAGRLLTVAAVHSGN